MDDEIDQQHQQEEQEGGRRVGVGDLNNNDEINNDLNNDIGAEIVVTDEHEASFFESLKSQTNGKMLKPTNTAYQLFFLYYKFSDSHAKPFGTLQKEASLQWKIGQTKAEWEKKHAQQIIKWWWQEANVIDKTLKARKRKREKLLEEFENGETENGNNNNNKKKTNDTNNANNT